jgi:hypothetical protein
MFEIQILSYWLLDTERDVKQGDTDVGNPTQSVGARPLKLAEVSGIKVILSF